MIYRFKHTAFFYEKRKSQRTMMTTTTTTQRGIKLHTTMSFIVTMILLVTSNAFTLQSTPSFVASQYPSTAIAKSSKGTGAATTARFPQKQFLLMSSNGDEESLSAPSSADDEVTSGNTRQTMVVKNISSGEIKEFNFVDPAMRANTNPFLVDWWAAIFFGFPVVLLFNDVFHFLPEEGELAALMAKFK
jgi:hypothetical protein